MNRSLPCNRKHENIAENRRTDRKIKLFYVLLMFDDEFVFVHYIAIGHICCCFKNKLLTIRISYNIHNYSLLNDLLSIWRNGEFNACGDFLRTPSTPHSDRVDLQSFNHGMEGKSIIWNENNSKQIFFRLCMNTAAVHMLRNN